MTMSLSLDSGAQACVSPHELSSLVPGRPPPPSLLLPRGKWDSSRRSPDPYREGRFPARGCGARHSGKKLPFPRGILPFPCGKPPPPTEICRLQVGNQRKRVEFVGEEVEYTEVDSILGGKREIEAAAGKPYRFEERGEPELLPVLVDHQQVVLQLKPPEYHRRRLALAGRRRDEAEAGRVGAHLHHGVAAEHGEVAAALEDDVDLRHEVPQPRLRQRGGVVAPVEGRDGGDPRHEREVRPGGRRVERPHQRRVHVRAERRVRHRGAQLHDERPGWLADRAPLHGDGGGRDEVPRRAAEPVERRRAGQHGGEVAAVRRDEEERAAAEDGHAHAVAGCRLAVAREAERQRVGHALRARDLRREGLGGGREPRDADGAGGELVGRLGRAGCRGGEGDRVERVDPVGGVRGQRGDRRPVLGVARRQRDDRAGEVEDERVAGLKRRRVEGGGRVLGKPYRFEERGEPELLPVLVDHQQVVLQLKPPEYHRRRLAGRRRDEAEAGRVGAHLHHGVAAEHGEVAAALEDDVDLRHEVPQPRLRQRGGVHRSKGATAATLDMNAKSGPAAAASNALTSAAYTSGRSAEYGTVELSSTTNGPDGLPIEPRSTAMAVAVTKYPGDPVVDPWSGAVPASMVVKSPRSGGMKKSGPPPKMATPTLLPVVVLPSLGRQSATELATPCVRATCAGSDCAEGASPATPTAPAGSL
ncbi:LOW QUALITY PROTEIN: hypothetical protein U9M48_043698 [Paspalum notatum var. saurae]|uniref:Uncharacterized protein n=1 Tax=Paspalum notatum var. saurae TaxID=547442 RepID=A0AAQ3XIU5_PASNO